MVATTYLEIEDQATGANNNTWGDINDANLAIIEQAICRVLNLSTTGGTTVLSSAQNRYPLIVVTGTLTSNAIIQCRTAEKRFAVINSTTGAFTVSMKTAAGSSVTIDRGRCSYVYCDGSGVVQELPPANGVAKAGDTMTGALEVPSSVSVKQAGAGYLQAWNTTGPSDAKIGRMIIDTSGNLTIDRMNDAYGTSKAALTIDKDGHTTRPNMGVVKAWYVPSNLTLFHVAGSAYGFHSGGAYPVGGTHFASGAFQTNGFAVKVLKSGYYMYRAKFRLVANYASALISLRVNGNQAAFIETGAAQAAARTVEMSGFLAFNVNDEITYQTTVSDNIEWGPDVTSLELVHAG